MAKDKYKEIRQEDFHKVCDIYAMWKPLNQSIKTISSRGVNFPDAISEVLVCYALGFKWNQGSSGDATDQDGRLVEIKATSNYHSDLSSFSPNTKFDRLFFVRLDQSQDIAEIYNMEMNFKSFSKLSTNNTQSVEDQQKEKRRPRLSLIEEINKRNIIPCYKIDLTKRTIEKI